MPLMLAINDPRLILLPHFRQVAPDRLGEWDQLCGIRPHPTLLSLADHIWRTYHEFFTKLPPQLQYTMRLYLDAVLLSLEEYHHFPQLVTDGFLSLQKVPCEDSHEIMLSPRLALYHHCDKWIYHGRRLTAAQEKRIAFLPLIRRARPQKVNNSGNRQDISSVCTSENELKALRVWQQVSWLGNYRHANVPSLGPSLQTRLRVLRGELPEVHPLWPTLASREYMVYAIHDDIALFDSWDARNGAWSEYRRLTITVMDQLRASNADSVTQYLKDTQGFLPKLMVPVSFWEVVLPLFRKLPAAYDVVSPEFVTRLASVFRTAQGLPLCLPLAVPECHQQKANWDRALIESLPLTPESRSTLEAAMVHYFGDSAVPTPQMKLEEWPPGDLDLLYSVCLAQYYSKNAFVVPLENRIMDSQLAAVLHRSKGDTAVAIKAQQFVCCPSCFKEHSMVCRPAAPPRSTVTTKKRKRAKVFMAAAVAGLSKVRINIHTMEVYCGRKTGKKVGKCEVAPACRFSLLGQMLCVKGVLYTLCTMPECGIVMVYDPEKNADPICAGCLKKMHEEDEEEPEEEKVKQEVVFADEEKEWGRGVKAKERWKKLKKNQGKRKKKKRKAKKRKFN